MFKMCNLCPETELKSNVQGKESKKNKNFSILSSISDHLKDQQAKDQQIKYDNEDTEQKKKSESQNDLRTEADMPKKDSEFEEKDPDSTFYVKLNMVEYIKETTQPEPLYQKNPDFRKKDDLMKKNQMILKNKEENKKNEANSKHILKNLTKSNEVPIEEGEEKTIENKNKVYKKKDQDDYKDPEKTIENKEFRTSSFTERERTEKITIKHKKPVINPDYEEKMRKKQERRQIIRKRKPCKFIN